VLPFSKQFLRATAECFARLSHRLGVCPSVCLSDTLVICIKTVQDRITKSLLCAARRTLVFSDKISCLWVRGFLSDEGVKEGCPLKKRYFAVLALIVRKRLQIDTDLLNIIASTGDGLFRFVNIDDLERP